MTTYPKIPLDINRTAMQGYPPATSVVGIYGNENSSASSVITLTPNTTAIEIAAVSGPAVMRWVRTGDTTASVVNALSGANFTHVIGSGLVRQFAVPQEVVTATAGSFVGANIQGGLFRRLAFKSTGVASVLVTEYAPYSY